MVHAGLPCMRLLLSFVRLPRRSLFPAVVTSICFLCLLYAGLFRGDTTSQIGLRHILPAPLLATITTGHSRFHLGEGPKRIITFGDSWSTDRSYSHNSRGESHQGRGNVWTQWLCSAISCTYHDNYAPPLGPASSFDVRGAVVNNSLLNDTWMIQNGYNLTGAVDFEGREGPPPDLIEQVQQWLAFEKSQIGRSRSTKAERQATIFCIWFALWDIWYLSAGTYADAENAVSRSVNALFHQLDVIAENWPLQSKIVLLDAIDMTFLPSWRKTRTGQYGSDALCEDQRNAVRLVEQWNIALRKRARSWKKGQIYIYETSSWLLNQLRRSQLDDEIIDETDALGSDGSLWVNVDAGCLGSNDDPSNVMQDSGGSIKCSDPDTYLFWDDHHLGPAAMRAIGTNIATEIIGL